MVTIICNHDAGGILLYFSQGKVNYMQPRNLIKASAGPKAKIGPFLGNKTGFKYTAGDPQVIIPVPSIKLKDFDLDTNTGYNHIIWKTQFTEQEK